MMERNVYIITLSALVFILIEHHQTLAAFTSSPDEIIPSKTKEITLRCEPQADGMMNVLAIHIKKKDDDTAGHGGDKSNLVGGQAPPVDTRSDNAVVDDNDDNDEDNDDNNNDDTDGDDDNGGGEETESKYNVDGDKVYGNYGNSRDGGRGYGGSYRKKRSAGDEFVRAMITSGGKIDVVPAADNYKAQGDLSDPAYLSVVMSNPDVGATGVYECQVTFFDLEGNIRVESEITMLNQATELSLESLEDRVSNLENQIPIITKMGGSMQSAVSQARDDTRLLGEDVHALKQENKELVETIADLTNQLNTLSARVNQMAVNQGGGSHGDSEDSSRGADRSSYDRSSYHNGNDYSNQGDRGYQSYNDDSRNQGRGGYGDSIYSQGGGINSGGSYGGDNSGYRDSGIGGLRQPANRINSDFQPHPQGEDVSEGLFKVDSRLDDVENTRIHALEEEVSDMRRRQDRVEDRLNLMAYELNITVEQLDKMEDFSWQGISESLQVLETMTIPILFRNISDLQYNISLLQQAVNFVNPQSALNDSEVDSLLQIIKSSSTTNTPSSTATTAKPEDVTSPPPLTTTTSEPIHYNDTHDTSSTASTTSSTSPPPTTTTTARITTEERDAQDDNDDDHQSDDEEAKAQRPASAKSCYICGNTDTQEPCDEDAPKDARRCADDQHYCITDVYQDGEKRQLYKRCATEKECQMMVSRSDRTCEDVSFMNPTPITCHFCCTASLCNDYIHPPYNIYKPNR